MILFALTLGAVRPSGRKVSPSTLSSSPSPWVARFRAPDRVLASTSSDVGSDTRGVTSGERATDR
jgi:hypothetical protein